MIRSLILPLLTASIVAGSKAAPLIVDGSTKIQHASLTVTSAATVTVANPVGVEFTLPALPEQPQSPTVQDFSPPDLNLEQTNVVVACPGCGTDGADLFPTFSFRFLETSAQDCSTTFTINGTESRLITDVAQESSFSLTAEDSTIYNLRTELSCRLDLPEGLPVYTPVVSVIIEPPYDTTLTKRFGFSVDPTTSGRVASLRLFSTIQIGQAWYNPSTDSTGAKEEALQVVDQATQLRAILSEPEDSDLTAQAKLHPFTGPTTEVAKPIESHGPNTKSESVDIKQTAACAVTSASQGIGDGVLSVIERLQKSLGDDRASRFRDTVQSAMRTMEDRFGCEKEKFEKEVVQVTVVEVGSEISEKAESIAPAVEAIDTSKIPKGLVRALEVLVAALGLGGLFAFLKRRFCSLRSQVERLADREERVKAREYRAAAKREARRRRWIQVKTIIFSCFTAKNGPLNDEEKQALVANGADQGSDDIYVHQALTHMGDIQYAHDVAVHLARQGHFADLRPHFHQGFSNAVVHQAIQATFSRLPPGVTRSRASSLPSYNSDVLPDYSSQPDVETIDSRHVANGIRRPASRTSTTGSSRFTPDSSIPDISTRPSFETLRTHDSEL